MQNLQPPGCAAVARIELATAEGEPASGPAATDLEFVDHHGHAARYSAATAAATPADRRPYAPLGAGGFVGSWPKPLP